MSLLKCIR